MSAEKKFEIGSSGKSGINLARDLIDDFVFPASRMMVTFRQTGEVPMTQVVPVCSSPQTVMAAFDLIVGLCTGCSQNLKLVAQILCEMFYADKEDALTEWEYLPPIGPRPANSFVGLKNAGATCYMNSVLQQLFMVEAIREGVLSADGACNVPDEDFSGDDRDDDVSGSSTEADVIVDDKQNRKEYNITILKQVQAIFAHLAKTKLQFYVPRGLWKHFRMLEGEPVNLREQQDAVEFFLRLIDLVDEALKALGFEQKLTKVLSGVYSDQKICKTCPHRYSKEQPFTVVNVDIKNFNNLQDSLQEYCKGELLDGSNAYYCERCDKKVI
jgi:ubiquitin carboxyl-terminal hydrolase 9/24